MQKRNPTVPWGEVDDSIWGATTQVGDQGTTMGRTVVFTSGLPETVAGFSVDRMCAGGMTCQAIGSSFIRSGVCGHHHRRRRRAHGSPPHGRRSGPESPYRHREDGCSPSTSTWATPLRSFTTGCLSTASSRSSKEEADEYAFHVLEKYFKALDAGYYDKHCVDMTVFSPTGWKVANNDEQAKRGTTLESIKNLRRFPFKAEGHVTPANASGLNDGACVSLLMSGKRCKELGIKPKMKFVGAAFIGVDPTIMGWGPVPSTEKVLKNFGMKFEDLDYH